MDENRRKSMRDILPKIFKCLKEQYIRNVAHQHLERKSYILRRGRQLMLTKTTHENRLMRAKRLLSKLKQPETKKLPPGWKSQSKK
ncbi:hypothetical protein ACTXT7_015824 [Hymenolepis weldensis]